MIGEWPIIDKKRVRKLAVTVVSTALSQPVNSFRSKGVFFLRCGKQGWLRRSNTREENRRK